MKLLHTIHDKTGQVIGQQMAGYPARAVQLWRSKHPEVIGVVTARNCNTPPQLIKEN